MKYFALFLTVLFAVFACSQANVVQLTDKNFDELVSEKDEWLIDFYADWCGYCKRLEPKFYAADRLLSMSSYSHTKMGIVNVQTNPGLAARFFVSRLPTVVHIVNKEVREVQNKQRENDIVSFVTLEEWRDVKPKSSLISPFSLLIVGLIGKSIKKLSSFSPWVLIYALVSFLMTAAGLYVYSSKASDIEDTKKTDTASETNQVKNVKSPKLRERKSKRID